MYDGLFKIGVFESCSLHALFPIRRYLNERVLFLFICVSQGQVVAQIGRELQLDAPVLNQQDRGPFRHEAASLVLKQNRGDQSQSARDGGGSCPQPCPDATPATEAS